MNTVSTAPVSAAAERNAAPILAVLKAHLGPSMRVLEIASGTGQHAEAFARAIPGLTWVPSDPDAEARSSIAARRSASGLANLQAPIRLDAADTAGWPNDVFDAIVCINMIHISPWSATEGLMQQGSSRLAAPGGLMVLYGPYLEAEIPLAPSNAAFDVDLKARNPAWGLRDREKVVRLARSHQLHLTRRIEMPANNLMLLFRRM